MKNNNCLITINIKVNREFQLINYDAVNILDICAKSLVNNQFVSMNGRILRIKLIHRPPLKIRSIYLKSSGNI